MQRREALRLLMAGGMLPAVPKDLLAFLAGAHPEAGYTLRTLNPHQDATAVAMMDLIIPATDTPGAKGAKVNEFIDVILTEWAMEDERKDFLDGLAGMDKKSTELFGKDFVDASAEQQVTLLRAMDEAVATKGPRRMRHNNTIPSDRDRQMKGEFFSVFKNITVHGYYTSEIGFSKELRQEIIPGAQHGCVPVPAERKA
jgi:glucoside 3-dehydrogenase (cytochrome c) hitch-hiker subunit